MVDRAKVLEWRLGGALAKVRRLGREQIEMLADLAIIKEDLNIMREDMAQIAEVVGAINVIVSPRPVELPLRESRGGPDPRFGAHKARKAREGTVRPARVSW
jgi:hypothetical protein